MSPSLPPCYFNGTLYSRGFILGQARAYNPQEMWIRLYWPMSAIPFSTRPSFFPTRWKPPVGWNGGDVHYCSWFPVFLVVQHLSFNRPVQVAIGFPSPCHILRLRFVFVSLLLYLYVAISSVPLPSFPWTPPQNLSSIALLLNPLLRYPNPAFYPSPLP